MKRMVNVLMMGLCAVVISGCASHSQKTPVPPSADFMMAQNDDGNAKIERMLIWRARFRVEVGNISNAVATATSLAKQHGGFVEQQSNSGDSSANMTLKIPGKAFTTALAGLETLGDITYRNVEGKDVTEEYVDIEARLKNKIVLRDRIKQLLEKATEVTDILEIETQLNRIQSDIDSMEGRIKSLKGQVDYATVDLSLSRKPVLGPVGYVLKGLWWGIEKLFVIRE